MRLIGTLALLGVGALAVGAVIAGPRLARAGAPLLREAARRGAERYTQLRGAAVELAEDVEDFVAEMRASRN